MLSAKNECDKYDLSSVRFLYTGAAPTGKETVEELLRRYPTWRIGQGYGEFDSYVSRGNTDLHQA